MNQFYTTGTGRSTKHVFAGTTRIASKVEKNNDGQGPNPNASPNAVGPIEKDLYFYHPDHLGSSNYVTDRQGRVYEHAEYFPFGETWVQETTNTQAIPYLYTGKELDTETGLYYFGARYYDPRTSVWQSADPMFGKYLPTFENGKQIFGAVGGVFESGNLGLFTYGRNNPLRLVDINGRWPTETHERIIDRAFPGLSQDQRQLLKDTSAWVDRAAGQTKAHNHEHAMKSPGESPAIARSAIDRNIQSHERSAKRLQGKTAEHASQIKPRAIEAFGQALHPVTDRTSPAHTDATGAPRDWLGIPATRSEYKAATEHQREEAAITPGQMNTAVEGARESFGRTFGSKALQEAITPLKQE